MNLQVVVQNESVGGDFAANFRSEIPNAIAKLTPKEKKVWSHVTQALHDVGLIHKTDAMAITVVCRTFVRWMDAEDQLSGYMRENNGNYFVVTPNGYHQPHQLFYVVRQLKKELLQWLPEAALTIPSFAKVVSRHDRPEQGELFDDPIAAHQARRSQIGLRAV